MLILHNASHKELIIKRFYNKRVEQTGNRHVFKYFLGGRSAHPYVIIQSIYIDNYQRNSDKIQIIKNMSRCPSCQLMIEFGFNENQAHAIAGIKKNINEIEEIKILEEKENLENQRIELEQILIG